MRLGLRVEGSMYPYVVCLGLKGVPIGTLRRKYIPYRVHGAYPKP